MLSISAGLAALLPFGLRWAKPLLRGLQQALFLQWQQQNLLHRGKNVPLFRRECDSALGERRFISELTLLAQLWERRSVTSVNPLSDLIKVHARSDIRKMAEVRCLEHLTPQKAREIKGAGENQQLFC